MDTCEPPGAWLFPQDRLQAKAARLSVIERGKVDCAKSNYSDWAWGLICESFSVSSGWASITSLWLSTK